MTRFRSSSGSKFGAFLAKFYRPGGGWLGFAEWGDGDWPVEFVNIYREQGAPAPRPPPARSRLVPVQEALEENDDLPTDALRDFLKQRQIGGAGATYPKKEDAVRALLAAAAVVPHFFV